MKSDIDKAQMVQDWVRGEEASQIAEGADYSEQQVRQAIVRTRESMVLLVTLVDFTNDKLRGVTLRLNILITLVAALFILLVLLELTP